MERKAALDNVPKAPTKTNPAPQKAYTEAQTLPDFFLTGKTPYEFWLTCVILLARLAFAYLAIRFLHQIHRSQLENATRAMSILFVIIATMVLITAGYNNEQIAPAFGLFGTIVGYILGRSDKGTNGATIRAPMAICLPHAMLLRNPKRRVMRNEQGAVSSIRGGARRFVLGVIATSVSHAENFPSAPRTPMAPGTGVYGRAIGPEDRSLMLPPQLNPAMRGGELQYVPTRQSPDLMVLETRAITDLSEGKSDVIVSSRAQTSLILQLYRPDLEGWQEYRLAPLSNTTIVCHQCGEEFRFSFNDGVELSEIVVEPPSLLRIYSDSGDMRWKWDVLKLQAASSGAQ